MPDPTSPKEILDAIRKQRAELLRLSVEYDKDRRALGRDEYEYEKAMANAVVVYVSNYKRENPSAKTLPAEDVRKAYSQGLVGEKWEAFLTTKASVEALDKLIRISQSILSSLQSELNWLTEELRNSGRD